MKIKEFDEITFQQAMQHLKDVFNTETFAKLQKAINKEIENAK
jgi:hypothetical protein